MKLGMGGELHLPASNFSRPANAGGESDPVDKATEPIASHCLGLK